MPKTSDLIPTSEVARLRNVDVRTVHRWVTRGELTPAVKAPGLRGALLFRREDVEAHAERGAA
jgi:excisionase family DNA binding protein